MNSSNTPAGKRGFPLLPDQLEAAQAWVDFGERTPSKPRFASSVVVLKDTPGGLQAIMTYRRGVSPLGILAFPGGSIEGPDDDAVDWAGPSPAAWAKSMGMDDEVLARRHVVAAIRELFEETGILLAGPDATSLVENITGPEWMKAREDIASQDATFAVLLNRRSLTLRTDLLKPLVNWISPDFAHRRFNTRFFAVVAPINQEPTLLASKGVWGRWVNAATVVEERATTALGDEVAQPNTAGMTLEQLVTPGVEIILEKISAARGCIAYLNHKRPQNAYQPRLVETDGEFSLEVDKSPSSEGAACRER